MPPSLTVDEPTPDAPESPPAGRLRRALGWIRRNAYLVLIAAAVLVLMRVVEFSPPPEVRVGQADVGSIVGDAPHQEFSGDLENPQSVQVRATLRLYPDNELLVARPDPDVDVQGRLLSQPVVTTILGMNATIEQTVRLEEGELEVSLAVNATPRLDRAQRKGKPSPPITLETEIIVKSKRVQWWSDHPEQRVNLETRAFLAKVEDGGHRVVFTVDEHLFSLDLEVHRAFGPLPESTFARGR
ncbi:MAG: hypothetical protein KUG77_06595 [Nannocystaceae bacterium]|nr:hypothetical protein [Nannocystaceae bacterium]